MSKGISIDSSGINETLAMFEKIEKNTTGTMKQCVYKGAGVVADTMQARVKALKTQSDNKRTDVRYPYDYEKEAILDNLGIAPIKADSIVNTKVGFDGYYYNKKGDRRPVPLLVNSINAGTSFLKKQAFVNATKRAAEGKCVNAMQKQLNEAIEKLTK